MFIHRQEPAVGSEDICQSVFVWKPDIFNTLWHHVLITVNGCQLAKLYVDSKEVFFSLDLVFKFTPNENLRDFIDL